MSNNYLQTDDDLLVFSEDPDDEVITPPDMEERWKIMVVDDDNYIHQVTSLVLDGFIFESKGTRLIHAYSAAQALDLLKDHPDTALILLDVIMETDRAGLDLVHKVRRTLDMEDVRIAIRTGEPGMLNEYKIAMEYSINDFKEKSSLTSNKLLATVSTLLREYVGLQGLHKQHSDLQAKLQANIDKLSRLAKIFNESMIANLILDGDLRITTTNSAFNKLTGFKLQSIIGKTPEFLDSEQNNKELLNAAWENLLDSGTWEGELWCVTKSRGDINIHLSPCL